MFAIFFQIEKFSPLRKWPLQIVYSNKETGYKVRMNEI